MKKIKLNTNYPLSPEDLETLKRLREIGTPSIPKSHRDSVDTRGLELEQHMAELDILMREQREILRKGRKHPWLF